MALLLWSGGCDSTLLLHDLLAAKVEDGQRVGEFVTLARDEPVRAISIDDPQVANGPQQKAARDKLRKRLKVFGNFEHTEVAVTKTGPDITPSGIPQAAMWLLHAALYLERSEDLYVGYVRGDDVWHKIAWLYQAFASIQGLTEKTGKLILPLEWADKSEVIDRLDKLKLLSGTWHCEKPKGNRACYACRSCRTHATAKFQIKQGIPR
jgi:Queuosine biosynthesis protein QueC